MKRGEIWWARLGGPSGDRPVVLLSRDSAYARLTGVTVVPVTTRIRGLLVEVTLGSDEGLDRDSVANLDNIQTVPTGQLVRMIGRLSPEKMRQVEDALRLALALPQFRR